MKIRTLGESYSKSPSTKIVAKSKKKGSMEVLNPDSQRKNVYLTGNEVFLAALGKLFEQGGILISAVCTVYRVLSYESLYPSIVMMVITMTIIVMMTSQKR